MSCSSAWPTSQAVVHPRRVANTGSAEATTARLEPSVTQAYAVPMAAGANEMIGRSAGCRGASGALAALAAVYGLRDGAAPPIRNLRTPDPAAALSALLGK